MEIGAVFVELRPDEVDLIIEIDVFGRKIFRDDFRAAAKGHFKITVEAAPRINRDRQRIDERRLAPAVAEKVSYRRINRRLFLALPINLEYHAPPESRIQREPNVFNNPFALYFGHCKFAVRGKNHAGGNFPAPPQLAGGKFSRARLRRAAQPLFPREVFGGDRIGLRVAQYR